MKMNERKLNEIAIEIKDQVLNELDCNPRIKNERGLMSAIKSRLRWLWLDAPRPIKKAR
jgi:hypothetical protein